MFLSNVAKVEINEVKHFISVSFQMIHLIVTLIFTTVNLYLLTYSEELYLHADNIVSKSKDFYFCTELYEIQEPEIYISKVTATVDVQLLFIFFC